MLTIEGKQFIGFKLSAAGEERFASFNPADGSELPYSFHKATANETHETCELAEKAFQSYRKVPGMDKANFLEAIAFEIEQLEDLINTCCAETALPQARIEGERTRTVNQLRLFAGLLRDGSWVNARLDVPTPAGADIRSMQRPLGPVAVFGASNFPLAFSVAGGDTVSALAAGCPVVVKAHPSHPATSELVARAIQSAAMATGMPNGVFSMLHGDGPVTGLALARHPAIKAIGFTGSYTAGKALFDAAAARPQPIPVYAEMSSSNPVFVLPEAQALYGEGIANGFAASVTLGVGQFCTNPGMLIYQPLSSTNDFSGMVNNHFQQAKGGVMLNKSIADAYQSKLQKLINADVAVLQATGLSGEHATAVKPVLLRTKARTFLASKLLEEEIFGPASMLIAVASKQEMLAIAKHLSGHLTATVHGTETELAEYAELIEVLEQKAGRLIINGFPTGVEVTHAMVHGGPFPSTTDSRSTSVGTNAIYRFTRPVCYQNFPAGLLPQELQNENPLNLWRLVNGKHTQAAI